MSKISGRPKSRAVQLMGLNAQDQTFFKGKYSSTHGIDVSSARMSIIGELCVFSGSVGSSFHLQNSRYIFVMMEYSHITDVWDHRNSLPDKWFLWPLFLGFPCIVRRNHCNFRQKERALKQLPVCTTRNNSRIFISKVSD